MIRIVMLRRNGATLGFECSGHAGYAEAGSDIVCSAVSTLTAAAANGLTEAAKIKASVTDDGKTLRCVLPETVGERQAQDAQLLFDTLEMALSGIRKDYGKYLKISDREV